MVDFSQWRDAGIDRRWCTSTPFVANDAIGLNGLNRSGRCDFDILHRTGSGNHVYRIVEGVGVGGRPFDTGSLYCPRQDLLCRIVRRGEAKLLHRIGKWLIVLVAGGVSDK